MKKKDFINGYTIVTIILVALLTISAIPLPVRAAPRTNGPRIDELLIKIYNYDTAEFSAFETGYIDLLDWPITPDLVGKWSNPPFSDTIVLDLYREIGMFSFDINNNKSMRSYPESVYGISPTWYPEVRHAIAHMVDKPYIINTILGNYGIQLEAPLMPWLRWYDSTMPTHSYDPAEACRILNATGWRGSPDPNLPPTDPNAKMKYPPGHLKAGQYVEDVLNRKPGDPGLIFYRRSDISTLRDAGGLLIYGDATHLGMEDIGIPVEDNNVPKSVSYPKVMYQKDFHIYTGYRSLGRDPDYLYDLWHSSKMNWDITEFAWNYNNINDALWDSYLEGVKYPTTIAIAETAARSACQRFGEMVFFVPLWTSLGYMAHKKPWHVLNVDSYGVRHWWNLYCINNPEIGITGGTLKWGFSSDVEMLNVIYSSYVKDWQILDKIFDTLIKFNPLNIAVDEPWMADSWSVGTWTNPDNGKMCSKVTFNLKSGIHFVDSLNGAELAEVTPEDVRFSFQYVYDKVGWNFPSVADIYLNQTTGKLKIENVGNTITFYESVLSAWALHWIGGLPIIPKFIFEGIADPHGFTPGGLPAKDVLVGCGPFYFVIYNPGVSCVLRAVGYPDSPEAATYFMTIVPNTDFTDIRPDWGIFLSNPRSGDWEVDILDETFVDSALGWEGPPGDIPQDINKDGKVDESDLWIVHRNFGASWAGWWPPQVHNIAIINVETCKNSGFPKPILCQGYNACIYVTVLNKGETTEWFHVTAYANTTAIGKLQVALAGLAPQESQIFTFAWNTVGFDKGNYTISATVDIVPQESDISDNSYADGSIKVTKPGDLTDDNAVNVLDLIIVGSALEPPWNPTADINHDHEINVLDLIIVSIYLE
jgi:hypothetical protein